MPKARIMRYFYFAVFLIFANITYANQELEEYLLNIQGIWIEEGQDCETSIRFDYPDKVYISTHLAEASGIFTLHPMSHKGKRYYYLDITISNSNGVMSCSAAGFKLGEILTFNMHPISNNEFTLSRSMRFTRQQ